MLDAPYDKRLMVEFQRVDDDTIGVMLRTGARRFDFDVTSSGVIENSGE